MAYEKPAIIEDMEIAEFDEDKVGVERLEALTEALMADMSPGEKIFFERCTVCHAPREVTHYTRQQWKGITPSMFPRAGLDEEESALVMDYPNDERRRRELTFHVLLGGCDLVARNPASWRTEVSVMA